MSSLKEQYFPLTCRFPHRVKRWERRAFSSMPECRIIKGSPVSVVEYQLELPEPCTLAFLTDLHFFEGKKCRNILRHTGELLKEYAPDYLLLGGDMCGDADDMPLLPDVLRTLAGYAGKRSFAVGGNWEYGKRWLAPGFWRDFYNKCNISYLENEVICESGIAFGGTADLSSWTPQLPPVVPDHFNILLTHNPDTVIALERGSLREFPQLILCGHTHGGQVNIPLIDRPLHIHSCYGKTFAHGAFLHKRRECAMLVSAGVGELSFPWRFNCRRELLIIRSRRK